MSQSLIDAALKADPVTAEIYLQVMQLVDDELLHHIKYGICSPEEMKLCEFIVRHSYLLINLKDLKIGDSS